VTLLRCDRLVLGYAGRPLLPAFDLAIERGRLTVVIGRNGSGKSTFFKTLLGLLPPVAGRVVRAQPGLRLTYVPQTSALDAALPLRARDIVGWGALTGWGFLRLVGPARARCDRALAEAGASALADRPFRDLSEGQKQRVLLARMLATEADLALLDEPTSAMDLVAEQETLAVLARQARERDMAVVIVTHVIGAASRHADQLLFLDRDDSIVLHGAPAEVTTHTAYLRQFGTPEVARGR
jgi:zinc transport system ATP-binding protein